MTSGQIPPDDRELGGTPGSDVAGTTTGFPVAAQPPRSHQRVPAHLLLIVLVSGLAVFALVLVVVAVFAQPGPPPKCPPLGCQGPPIRRGPLAQQSLAVQQSVGKLYSLHRGFSVRSYPIGSVYPSESSTTDGIAFSYPFKDQYGGTSELAILGTSDVKATPQKLVTDEVNRIAPNATVAYVLPGAYVGYAPGYGEVVTTQVASSSGSTATYELIVLAAVQHGYGVTVVASGQLLGNVAPGSVFYNGHPSPATVNVAYVADPTVDSIQFPG